MKGHKLHHATKPVWFFLFLIVLKSVFAESWKWVPEDRHPCNIREIALEHVEAEFGVGGLPPLFPEPVVLRYNSTLPLSELKDGGRNDKRKIENARSMTILRRNADFRQKTAQSRIQHNFPPEFNVTLSSSNQFSERRRTIPFSRYLQETLTGGGETLPTKLANESWYLFGETFSDEWRGLTDQYELPPCRTCKAEWCALSFGIGNRGSGVQWHVHGPGFSEALHGRKHWVLYPPDQKPRDFHKDQASRQWMEYVYPTIPTKERPWECTLEPGDLIYFPDNWWHATINLDPYTAFISTFTTEHNVEMLTRNDEF